MKMRFVCKYFWIVSLFFFEAGLVQADTPNAGVALLGTYVQSQLPDQEPTDPFTHLYDISFPTQHEFELDLNGLKGSASEVPEDRVNHRFQNDVVLANAQILVTIRRGGSGVEVYAQSSVGIWKQQATLVSVAGQKDFDIQHIELHKNRLDGIELDALVSAIGEPISGIKLELLVGQNFLKVQSIGAIEALRVEAPCEFVVLPDFFADDIVIAASDLPTGSFELPSENFLLNFRHGGESIVMNVWDNNDQDIRVLSRKSGHSASIQATEITFGHEGSIWVSVLAEPGIWHTRMISLEDKDRILPLAWKNPFSAVWRVDWRRSDRLTDSWEFAVEDQNGKFRKSDLFEASRDDWTDKDWWSPRNPRRRWNTGLGGYEYPCWFDKEGNAHLQPLKEKLEFVGPAVIYPINRNAHTPLDKFSVADVVRATLGVGPCQYILDVEGQDMAFRGRPTCEVRDVLNGIYKKGDHLGRSDDVHMALDDVGTFIRLIRSRIEQYAQFGREMDAYLEAEKRKPNAPMLFIEEMQGLNHKVEEAIEERKEGINTPTYAVDLVQTFRENLVLYKGSNAVGKCEALTEKFVEIGDNQDELVAECRLAVRLLRQHAAIALVLHPDAAPLVEQIRKRTQEILRSPVNYEAARH